MLKKTTSNSFLTIASFVGMMTIGMTYGSLGALLVPIAQFFHTKLISVGYPMVFFSLGFLVGSLLVSVAWQIRRARLFLTFFSSINIFALLFIYAIHPNLNVVLIFLLISGMASAVIHSGLDSFFAEIYPKNRAKMLNILHVFFGLGGFLGPFVISLILSANISWYLIFLLMALLSIPLPLLYSRKSPYQNLEFVPMEKEAPRSAAKTIFFKPLFWITMGSMFFYVATETAMTSWTSVFLTEVRQFYPAVGSFGVSLVWLTIILGRVFFSRYLKFHNLSFFLIISSLLNIFFIFMFFFLKQIEMEFLFLIISGLLLSFMYPGLLAQGGDLFPYQIGYVIGAMGASGTIGSIITPWILGPLSEKFSMARIVFLLPVLSLITALFLITIHRFRYSTYNSAINPQIGQ